MAELAPLAETGFIGIVSATRDRLAAQEVESPSMNPLSPIPAVLVLLAAIFTTRILVRALGAPPAARRFATIDGLRGYLALFVFVHHAAITYFNLRTGSWVRVPSTFYNFLGHGSVALFFMITGFLFFSKILDGRAKAIDWAKLYVSRLLRLTPMYLLSMLLLLTIVGIVTQWQLREEPTIVLREAFKWLTFTILDSPDVNGLANTFTIDAGVTWSLPYEWFYYLLLPLFAFVIGARVPVVYLVIALATLTYLVHWDPEPYRSAAFLGGMAAAVFQRNSWPRRLAATHGASLLAIGCLATCLAFPNVYAVGPLVLLSIAFILIACGTNLFGVLVSTVSRSLGEAAYSIYLLHGIVLYVTFHFIFDHVSAAGLSAEQHWLVVAAATPLLVTICFVTFRSVERPALGQTNNVTAWINARLPGSRAHAR
ncbi:MAG: acyltransferase [Rhodocyclales bacterium]|nr:acyltransferase [Rhodocyclales bacterium]